MSYMRILPRDFFNEADLLKCLGFLVLRLEDLGMSDIHPENLDNLNILQDESDGSISVEGFHLTLQDDTTLKLCRPLNSRESMPLFCVDDEYNEIKVFDDKGQISPEMLQRIGIQHQANLQA
jgi:hypothetical protein